MKIYTKLRCIIEFFCAEKIALINICRMFMEIKQLMCLSGGGSKYVLKIALSLQICVVCKLFITDKNSDNGGDYVRK